MRRVVFTAVLAVFCFWTSAIFAAQVRVKDFDTGVRTVSIWEIAEALGHPGWSGIGEIQKANPQLPKLKKVGDILDIRIYPDTRINVPKGWSLEGIDVRVVEPVKESVGSIESSVPLQWPGNQVRRRESLWLFPDWFPFLLIFLAAVAVFGWLYLIFGRQRASEAGQPIVPGGIRQDEPQRLEERFNRIAERRYGESNPSADLSVERPMRISPIESGFLNGHGRVQYRDRTVERRLENEPAYRARFRFPDGTEQDLFFLQACGNDVMAGTRYHGFTFSASRVVVPASTPQPVSVPTEPTEQSAVPIATSQNHQNFVTIRVFDELGRVLMEIDGENPSFQVERGPQGTKVSRRS